MKLLWLVIDKFRLRLKIAIAIFFILISTMFLITCSNEPKQEIRNDFKKYYQEFNVDGSFALFNENENKFILFNQGQFNKAFSPASTFKICNSLIGLETGVIPNKHYVLAWDSVKRNPIWDQNHSLESAFKNSVVWYYQELARRVGKDKMKYWVNKANYGNKNIGGGIDKFWLEGSLRISPKQQIEFIRQLYFDQLPFSKRNMSLVKEMMLVKDSLGYKIHAKSGWGMDGDHDIGWFVGYIKTNDNVYFFSNCIHIKTKELEDINKAIIFDKCRIDISNLIFKELHLVQF